MTQQDTQSAQICQTHVYQELPKLHSTYANVIKSLIPNHDDKASTLPSDIYTVEKLVIDQQNLSDYRKICGFANDGRVPATYFSVQAQILQMNIMAKDNFPFAMLGLVHLHNQVVCYRPVYDTEIVSMTVRLDNLTPHKRGQQFDFIMEAKVSDEVVWQGVSTYLSRQKKTKEEREKAKQEKQNMVMTAAAPIGQLIDTIEVGEDIGRRYAFVSGDFNLIHLHALSAKAFGFPRAIAHGMWSKARALSQFYDLPKSYQVTPDFYTPIFLPSRVRLFAKKEINKIQFAIYASDSDKLHMTGVIDFLTTN